MDNEQVLSGSYIQKLLKLTMKSGSNSKLQNFCRHSQPLQENVICM